MGNASRLGLNVILSLSPTTNQHLSFIQFTNTTQHPWTFTNRVGLSCLLQFYYLHLGSFSFLSLPLLVNSYRIGERIYSNFKPKLYTLGQFDILLFFSFSFFFFAKYRNFIKPETKGTGVSSRPQT